ncbi:hemagglutinin repeat-containing protein [Megasphaera elsdenii]|uniref:Filamentous hemagglutinin family N-terminal domain protein n=1 Tax=Megasphaera elsdenii DSM 20460 TaxID=1064535 RepID=G0VR35_MEGEL|nr:hemagglutinin repeat-containing protein [Megasphaera elsdenii]CCC72280.1 filamentous hemagglutinin family N-terminal domain protein [Megasphaera elsdenii DSM 20460]
MLLFYQANVPSPAFKISKLPYRSELPIESFRGAVRTAQSRDNKTLQGLELVEAGRNLRKDLKGKSPADVTSVGLHVGIGSSSFKQESEVNHQTYAGGRMMSAGDVTVRAESSPKNKGNLTAVGESIQGKNVSLTASGAVRLQAGTNEETIRDSYQSHGASIGASFHGGLTSIDASYGKMKDQGTTTRVTHTGSHVTAQDRLMMSSGKDTTLVGSQLQGQSVTVKTGGNLHIESVQDSETYRGNRSSTGISVAYSPSVDVQENFLPQGTHATHFTYTGTGAKSGNASYSRGKTTSDYASVTEQAGIYAGDQGYDVDVNKDTQLKGAVIASTADANRNHLTTGTLHLEDIQNKAAYDVKNTGVAYNHYASDQERNQHFNETGLTPDILPGAAKDAHSVTRSAISQGTIQVTQGVTDVTKINRDTAHALQTLNHIFDKQKVEERQELARLFAKNADELLHYYDRDGKFDKALAHGLVAEITSQLAGNKAGSGFAAGMTNELLMNKIKEWAGNDPAKAQWISAALGATVNAATGKNIQTGGATAQYGIKWNGLDHFQQSFDGDGSYPSIAQYLHENLEQGNFNGVIMVLESAYIISRDNPDVPEVGENDFIYTFNRAAQYLGITYKYCSDFTMTENLRELLRLYAETLPKRTRASVEGHLGIGLGGKIGFISIGGNVYLNISTNSPLTINNNGEIGLFDGLLGSSYERSYNPQTGSYTEDFSILSNLKPIGTTYTGKDVYLSIGGEIYVGGGGGLLLKINTIKLAEDMGLIPRTVDKVGREYIEMLIKDEI